MENEPTGGKDFSLQRSIREETRQIGLTEKFGAPLENARAIAEGLFGESVNMDVLTPEQKEKISAVDIGFRRSVRKFLEGRRKK